MEIRKSLKRTDYTIAWLCALEKSELLAARRMLDEEHEDCVSNMQFEDDNAYVFGSINKHNVVVACMPLGRPGKVSASIMVDTLIKTFPNLRMHLLVGIGGGVPTRPSYDIRLGDVVVGCPENSSAHAVVQYDLYRANQDDEIEAIGYLDKPDRKLVNALTKLVNNQRIGKSDFRRHLALAETSTLILPESTDKLYISTYCHVKTNQSGSCDACSEDALVPRLERKSAEGPLVHLGTILSGDRLVEDAMLRDQLADKFDALCFEMTAAGVVEQTHCLVIRGVADYSDSHKNYQWQGYAAATSAAFAREFLYTVQPLTMASVAPMEQEKDMGAENIYLYPEHPQAHFIAREEPYSRIQQLHDDPRRAGQDNIAFLLGRGGSGKTSLALHYCEKSKHSGRFGNILWLDATSQESVVQGFIKIAMALGMANLTTNASSLQGPESYALPPKPESLLRKADMDQAVVKFVKEKLYSSPKSFLMVFDGFDQPQTFPEGLQPFIPQAAHGCILVTTTEPRLRCPSEEKIELSALSEF